MAWLAEHFDTEYWTDWHSDLEAERRQRQERKVVSALYGERTRGGDVTPLGPVRMTHCFAYVDLFNNDDDPAGISGEAV